MGLGGRGRKFLMCCGGDKLNTDIIESNRKEISELKTSQSMILWSLHQQRKINPSVTVDMTSWLGSSDTLEEQPSEHETSSESGQTDAAGTAPSNRIRATNIVTPSVHFDKNDVNLHQSQQMELLNKIGLQYCTEENRAKKNELYDQYNELAQQMKVMESLGYAYEDTIPALIRDDDDD